MVPRHRRCRGPGEVVVQHLPDRVVLGESDVRHGLVEAGDRPPVHLLVRPISAVEPHDRCLVAVGVGVGRGATDRLGPVRGEPLGVIGAEPVTERVAHHLVSQHPVMPCTGQTVETLGAAGGLVDGLHAPRMARPCVPCSQAREMTA